MNKDQLNAYEKGQKIKDYQLKAMIPGLKSITKNGITLGTNKLSTTTMAMLLGRCNYKEANNI